METPESHWAGGYQNSPDSINVTDSRMTDDIVRTQDIDGDLWGYVSMLSGDGGATIKVPTYYLTCLERCAITETISISL